MQLNALTRDSHLSGTRVPLRSLPIKSNSGEFSKRIIIKICIAKGRMSPKLKKAVPYP